MSLEIGKRYKCKSPYREVVITREAVDSGPFRYWGDFYHPGDRNPFSTSWLFMKNGEWTPSPAGSENDLILDEDLGIES